MALKKKPKVKKRGFDDMVICLITVIIKHIFTDNKLVYSSRLIAPVQHKNYDQMIIKGCKNEVREKFKPCR